MAIEDESDNNGATMTEALKKDVDKAENAVVEMAKLTKPKENTKKIHTKEVDKMREEHVVEVGAWEASTLESQ